MLIEAAVPEIEERANEVLGRMTDHQMSVRLELQRQKRSGVGTVETLDIRISDAAGTRDYELFSGGEAFRINFALRIALSRLLARKAGTELRLLIIDEGFGSQDVTGRETLVTVLNAIRQDFEKVLVVTHIEELQDAFSYQLRIEKRPGGSVIVRG
jgi:exonuclease SbcC